MKKFAKIGLVLGMLIATVSTYAANISLSVIEEKGKAVNFVLDNAESVSIVLKNEEGASIYSEVATAKAGKIDRKYDLNYLPSGRYYLQAETETKVVTYTINLDENTTVEQESVKEVFKPVVFTKDSKVMLQLLNINEAPISVSIYDINSNLLYQQDFNGEINFTKKFALKKIFSANYTMVISYNGMTFTKEIAL